MTDAQGKRPPPDIPISPKKTLSDDLHGNAQMEGVVVEISPLKMSRNKDSKAYLDGHISDERQQLRFIGFCDKLHEDMKNFHQKREPVLIRNCNLYKGKYDHQPQIFINTGRTTIHKSSTHFDLKPEEMKPATVTLADYPTLEKYTKVNVEAKVLKVKQRMFVGQDIKKQIQKIIIAMKQITPPYSYGRKI